MTSVDKQKPRANAPGEVPIPPFLKWAGGKRWLVQRYGNLFPRQFRRYFEPFLGGGAVYFYLRPQRAILGDVNPELIGAYRAIQADWPAVRRSLAYHQRVHSQLSDAYYYQIRDKSPMTLVQRASRMIYLNRTCFNGIYRVNKNGKFNVPRGTKDAVLMDTDDFKSMSALLATAELRVADFEELIDEAGEDDLVFADPPYTVRHNFNGFVKYNEVLFSWADQERLALALQRAAVRGAKIVATNANHNSVRRLYSAWEFSTKSVSRFSQISADGNSRRQFEELIITSNI